MSEDSYQVLPGTLDTPNLVTRISIEYDIHNPSKLLVKNEDLYIGYFNYPSDPSNIRHAVVNELTDEVYIYLYLPNNNTSGQLQTLVFKLLSLESIPKYGGKHSSLTLKQLQSISSKHGVKYSGINKADLVKALKKKRLI